MCALHYRPGIEVVPGYELMSLLGRGGFGEVWKAKGPGGVTLAIKVIDKVDDKAGRKEFRALRLIKDINHPNLVTISGFWIKDSDGRLIDPEAISDDSTARGVRPAELIIAMDLGEMTLLEYLERCRKGLLENQKGGIPADELLEYTEAAAKAIDYLNTRHDVQHRDIKPQNILIVGGSAKICDLGLASTVSSVRTSMGGAGSLAYMAPEVYTSKRPSRATDQYSLAVAFVELRTGRLPLSDCESYSVLDDAKRRGILDLSWLDEPERTVIAKATSLDPDDRYPRCLDMVRALRRACETGADTVRAADTTHVLGDYILERRLHHRTGEEIFEATGPEGHRVLLVARTPADSPDLADGKTLSLVRERSRHQPHLAELYEIVRLSETNRAVPPRLFEGPHPPAFAKLLLVSRCVSRNLADSVTRGGVTPGKLMGYLEQIAEVVDFLNEPQHEMGGRRLRLMHGNVRPVNFLIDNDHVYLTNFSAVQALEGDERVFAAGPDIPEGPYTPPEFADGKLTRWSDQYMLAVAYLQLRTGRPSSGLTGSTQSDRLAGEPRRLDLAELNAAEKEILRRATAANPSQRFASCGEMVRALYGAWNVLVARDTPKDSGAEPTQQHPSRSGSAAEAATRVAPRPKFDATGPTIDLDIVADRAGTLIAPVHETRLSTDTDREGAVAEGSRTQPQPPDAARERHAPHRTPHAPHAEARLKPAAVAAGRDRPVWRRPAAIGSVLAVLTAAVVTLFLIGNDPDPQPLPDTDASRWYERNVTPPVIKLDFAAAVDALSGAPPEAPLAAWRKQLQSQWQQHIEGLRARKQTEASVRELNELLARLEPNELVTAWRAEDLEALVERGNAELEAQKNDAALMTFQFVLRAIDDLQKARNGPFDQHQSNLQRAALGSARANARLSQWAAVQADLARVGGTENLSGDDPFHWKALDLLARHKTSGNVPKSEAEEVERVLKSDLSAIDKLEWRMFSEAVAEIRSGKAEQLKRQLSERLAQVATLVKQNKEAQAWSELEAIVQDPAVNSLVSSPAGGLPAYECLRLRLTVLSQLPNAPAADAKRELARFANFLAAKTVPPRDWLLEACMAAKTLALKTKPGTNDPADPEVADRVRRLLDKAHAMAKEGQEKQRIADLIRSMREVADSARLAGLRQRRDSADGKSDFQALRDACRQLASEGAADPLLAAMLAESLLMLDEDATSAAAEVEKIKPVEMAAQEAAYVFHVQGLILAASDPTVAAERFMKAWHQNDAKDAKTVFAWPWQQSRSRVERALAALLKAGEASQDLPGDDVKLKRKRFSAEKAARAHAWYTSAANMWVSIRGTKPTPAQEEQLMQLRVNRALTAAYAAHANALDLLDKLVDLPAEKVSAHVLSASIDLHRTRLQQDAKNTNSRDRIIRNYARLLEWSRQKKAVQDETTFDQIVAPGFEFLSQSVRSASDVSAEARKAAGAICGERGRMARLYATIEQKFSTADTDPMEVSLASYQEALKYDDQVAEHFAGRAIAAYVVGDIKEEDRSRMIRDDAQRVGALTGAEPRLRSLAEGLVGLAALSESYAILDFDAKTKKLEDSAQRLQAAVEDFKPLSDDYQQSDEFQRFLMARGGAYLKLANYVPIGQKKAWLEKATALAESIVKKYVDRKRPEDAFALWGNALEDFGWFNVDRQGYMASWPKFGEQYRIAPLHDKRAKARARINLGRSMYRYYAANLGDLHKARREAQLALQLATARSLSLGTDDLKIAQRKKEALREAQAALNRAKDKLGEGESAIRPELVKARGFLTDAIKEARDWRVIQADAHNWVGRIDALSPIDDFDKADEHFLKAVELVGERHHHWPELMLDRAKNCVEFARRHLVPGRVNLAKARPLINRAIAQVEPLANRANDRVHDRHFIPARGIGLQGYLWLGDVDGTDRAYKSLLAGLESSDRRSAAHLEAARRILSLPKHSDTARLLTDKERELAERTFSELSSSSKGMTYERKWEFYRINRDYYFYWQDRATLASSQYQQDAAPENRAISTMVLEQLVKHLEFFVELAKDEAWVTQSRQRNDMDWRDFGGDLPRWAGLLEHYRNEQVTLRASRR